MSKKLNCWEAKACGLEPGGAKVAEHGVCPAATELAGDGTHSGDNGGRVCWAVPGTLCGDVEEGLSCLRCDFIGKVLKEEGAQAALPNAIRRDERRRLNFALLVAGMLWSLLAVIGPGLLSGLPGARVSSIAILIVAMTLGLTAYLRLGRGARKTIVRLGFTLAVLQAFAISLIETAWLDAGIISIQVSWSCVIILSLPLLLPTSRRETIFYSLIIATMSIAVYFLGIWRSGASIASLPVLLSRILPQFVCVAVAELPARLMGQLSAGARRLGSYELIDRIGAGGMGEVWRAMHRMLARPAAIKLIRPSMLELSSEKGATKIFRRFEKEARATALLESPHTVEVYDFGIDDEGSFYYVMEHLRGINMQELVERHGPQPATRVVHFMRQACHSLGEAHSAGLVHRDIKPANIFTCQHGPDFDFTKVLDFGLVQEIGESEGDGSSGKSGSSGTPDYMAPEQQAEYDWRADPRADLYSLGCVAYWLLSGEMVYPGGTFLASILKQAQYDPQAPSRRTSNEIPPKLERIVMSCIARDPNERPKNAGELAMQLTACAESIGDWTQEQAEAWWREHMHAKRAGSMRVQTAGA